MPIKEAPGQPMVVRRDHNGTHRGETVYSRAGDVVEFIKETAGYRDPITGYTASIFVYQDRSGNRYSGPDDLFYMAPPGTKLKKQILPSK